MAAPRRVVSYSEIDTWRQCPLKWVLGYKERWIPPGGGGSIHTDRGTAFHSVLECRYTVIKSFQKGTEPKPFSPAAWVLVLQKARTAVVELIQTMDEPELMQWMYDGYCEANDDADRYWWVEEVEGRKLMVLPHPTGGASRFVLKTKIDLVIRDMSKVGNPRIIVDHKSGTNLPSGRELDLDDQFGLYELTYRLEGIPVLGTVYNAMRTKQNVADFPNYSGKQKPQTLEDRHRRVWMKRSNNELKAIAVDAYWAIDTAYSAQTEKKPYSSPDPRNCGWKCDFSDPHVAARKMGMPVPVLLVQTGYKQNFERH
jgi:hypothetical protein